MKPILTITAFLFIFLITGCSKPEKPESNILNDISGVWRPSNGNKLWTISNRDNNFLFAIGTEAYPLKVGTIDTDRKSINLVDTRSYEKPAIFTLKQIFAADNKSFHLAFTSDTGEVVDLQFVRKISTNDLANFGAIIPFASAGEKVGADSHNIAVLPMFAISLPPVKGKSTLDIVETKDSTKNYTGSCGKSIVQVMGVENIVGNFFTFGTQTSDTIIRSDNTKELIFKDYSDYNGIACVPTKSGSKLLIWSNCAGNACGDDFSFVVIDPEIPAYLAPQNPSKGTCDQNCASKILENYFPHKINRH